VKVLFPVSGVETYLWLPPAVAFAVSFFTSMCGVSGAFLLLPFQMSFLGFVSPAVSATNLVFNVVAIPSGVYHYVHERRMVWPLNWVVIAGTLPGVFVGGLMRLHWLLDPRAFQAFVGFVLLYIGVRLLRSVVKSGTGDGRADNQPSGGRPDPNRAFTVQLLAFNWRQLAYQYRDARYRCSTPLLFAVSLGVGVVGGAYGIGGGSILAPFLVAILGLPLHTVAGATLMGTLVTSVAGLAFYQLIGPLCLQSGTPVRPDWLLGLLFGAGGIGGMYLGARTQRFVSARWLKLLLGVLVAFVALRYVWAHLSTLGGTA